MFVWSDQNGQWEYSLLGLNLSILDVTAIRMDRTDKRNTANGAWGQMRVNGRGYTHSIVAGVAFRRPSCQFSTGTGMQVSLMVSWQRKDSGGPLSSSSWALLWTVSTTEGRWRGRGGAEEVRGREGGGEWFGGRESRTQIWGQEAKRGRKKEDREDTKTYEARTTEHGTRKQSQALSRAHFFKTSTADHINTIT